MVRLTKIRGSGDDCPSGRTCPAVHATDRGTLVIIGPQVTDPEALAQTNIDPGEVAIEIPASMLPEVTG
jgi:hypothetical protein